MCPRPVLWVLNLNQVPKAVQWVRYHFSRVQVVEPLQQLNAGRLPASRRSNEGDLLSGCQGEVEGLEDGDLLPGRVAELGVLEADVAVDAFLREIDIK